MGRSHSFLVHFLSTILAVILLWKSEISFLHALVAYLNRASFTSLIYLFCFCCKKKDEYWPNLLCQMPILIYNSLHDSTTSSTVDLVYTYRYTILSSTSRCTSTCVQDWRSLNIFQCTSGSVRAKTRISPRL